jgi:hypothetical protein
MPCRRGPRHIAGDRARQLPAVADLPGESGRQTSVTAGTVKRGSKLALTIWFWAA